MGHLFLLFGLQGPLNFSKLTLNQFKFFLLWNRLFKSFIPFSIPSVASNHVPDYMRKRGHINIMWEANVERSKGVIVV